MNEDSKFWYEVIFDMLSLDKMSDEEITFFETKLKDLVEEYLQKHEYISKLKHIDVSNVIVVLRSEPDRSSDWPHGEIE